MMPDGPLRFSKAPSTSVFQIHRHKRHSGDQRGTASNKQRCARPDKIPVAVELAAAFDSPGRLVVKRSWARSIGHF
jgi:hypothetical protein